jgi:hypothetical protein
MSLHLRYLSDKFDHLIQNNEHNIGKINVFENNNYIEKLRECNLKLGWLT